MKDLTLYLLSYLVENPETLDVEESETESGQVTLVIRVAKEDMGRVIGKEGRTIRAIRDIVKILALKQNKHVDVQLAE